MAAGDRTDPYRSYNFLVEIDGITRAGFRDCSGLGSGSAPIEYREGNDKQLTTRKLPGLVSYPNITLSRGVTDDPALWQWREQVARGQVSRRNGSSRSASPRGSSTGASPPRCRRAARSSRCAATPGPGPPARATATERGRR